MKMWRPSDQRIQKSHMYQFKCYLEKNTGLKNNSNYREMHNWSVSNSPLFWSHIIKYFGVKFKGEVSPYCNDDLAFLNYSWFPKVKINFAQNLLKFKDSSSIAINSIGENGVIRKISYKNLYSESAKLESYIKKYIGKKDVLAAYMPNIAETTIAMLATTSLGGVFTSTSCDFGVEGVVDRFGQSKPKVLIAATSYLYNGKIYSLKEKIQQIVEKVDSIEKVILVDFLKNEDVFEGKKYISYEDAINSNAKKLSFVEMNFSDPLYIMYSSGTTGSPKCIVHSIGGTLLQHIKELGLHTDLTQKKNIFYFTTCGWMMWNWLVSSLFFGAQITLYEGSPGFPSLEEFLNIIKKEKINIFGTSPKFLRALEDTYPKKKFKFDSLETILSTGAPLLPEQFDYVYKNIKSDVQLSSICGGTDIIGCFMLGNPILPVYRGQIQCLGLGMNVSCFDENGRIVKDSEGELVCRSSFVSMPIYFLNDPDNEKYKKAYFSKYENVWHHGDFITITSDNQVKVFGRSDATLNPGGVRIGTSEIYRQTENIKYLEDSICVGKQKDGDVDVLLFVKLVSGETLTVDRINEIKSLIKTKTTPRHVPKQIYAVSGIPYTRSGKKMEMAVTRLINGRELNNIEAVSNPDCLEEYKNVES